MVVEYQMSNKTRVKCKKGRKIVTPKRGSTTKLKKALIQGKVPG